MHAFEWAPQMHVLKYADCAVIHGGMTSVYECIHQGVPMVAYPFSDIFDQFGTANRVRYHGLGVVGDRKNDNANQISSHINHVLDDDTIFARVDGMRQHIKRYAQTERLVQTVDKIIAKNTRDDHSGQTTSAGRHRRRIH